MPAEVVDHGTLEPRGVRRLRIQRRRPLVITNGKLVVRVILAEIFFVDFAAVERAIVDLVRCRVFVEHLLEQIQRFFRFLLVARQRAGQGNQLDLVVDGERLVIDGVRFGDRFLRRDFGAMLRRGGGQIGIHLDGLRHRALTARPTGLAAVAGLEVEPLEVPELPEVSLARLHQLLDLVGEVGDVIGTGLDDLGVLRRRLHVDDGVIVFTIPAFATAKSDDNDGGQNLINNEIAKTVGVH